MRSFRQLAALGIVLVPLTVAWPAPAHAGGGAGLTVTASMDGQDQNLLVGSLHKVSVTVTDVPGEASLRQIRVAVADLDPTSFPVLCDAGANGAMALEPNQSLHCTTELRAEAGFRTIEASAVAYVPGQLTPMARRVPLHYTGVMPPPPPAARAALLPPPPAHHSTPAGGHQAADPPVSVPLPIMPPPGGVPAADPPGIGALDPPAAGCGGSGSGSAAGTSGQGSNSAGLAACCPNAAGASGARTGSGSGCCSGSASGSSQGSNSGALSAGAGSACCPGSGRSAGAGGHTAAGGPACDGAHSAKAEAGLARLAHTGTSAPVLGLAAFAVVCGGAALVWRVRTARR